MMEIQINGERRPVEDGVSVAGLVESLGLPGDRVAVERNREIVRRQDWEQVCLAPEDRLEIVHFVGGG
jgi:thiamine biosynthesis protein ThiS